jgi:hypothetical protein
MAFDGAPWVVEGANTSAAAGRVLANAATRDAQGVMLPGDLKVTATPTASQAVRIATGAAVVRNVQAPGESYIGLARSLTDVNINVTGTPRTDLLVGEIIDPDFPPWQPNSVPDPLNGPFWRPHVLQGVGAGTIRASDVVSYSAIALARIAVPATGNITTGMITDLRRLVQPRTWRELYSFNCGANPVTLQSTDFVDWPTVQMNVFVPEWATWADMRTDIAGILQLGPLADVELRSHMGPFQISGSMLLDQDSFSDGVRQSAILTNSGFIPPQYRGTTITLKAMARVIFGDSHPGRYKVDATTHVGYDIQFTERTV